MNCKGRVLAQGRKHCSQFGSFLPKFRLSREKLLNFAIVIWEECLGDSHFAFLGKRGLGEEGNGGKSLNGCFPEEEEDVSKAEEKSGRGERERDREEGH